MILTNRVCHLPSVFQPSPTTLEDLFGKILLCGFISHSDRHKLKVLLLEESLSDEHHAIINRLLYGVRRGFLRITM
ncbi:hypothetical protein NG798_02930 [Ancylothrix sp. C2]|uniref:hypothetical protein n=1 Tax=Ancylothrix sp. D3o TaxID=2953691 RepID=UPI0021BB4D58|nr:hypothetical protein [Ancylothrix sp. D3o]MCT7948734.1 hypothetical protein [Ancylothrix sp. D3o]